MQVDAGTCNHTFLKGGHAEPETHFLLMRSLWKLWSRGLSGRRGRWGKLKWRVVQLKGWAKVEPWAWRWLDYSAALVVRKIDRGLHIAFVILVYMHATFGIQYLI
jgi:hypothetical protein